MNVKNGCTSINFAQTIKTILNPPDLPLNGFTKRGKQDEEKCVQFLARNLREKSF